jgi:hypothetical protein
MAAEAFVLPYLGRSIGVVFWESRSRPPARREAEPPGLAIYAPGSLSPGELAELQTCLCTSLGRALAADAPGVRRALWWWWTGGLIAAVLLAAHALPPGPQFAWLALAAGLTALPVAQARPVSPITARGAAAARRVARRVTLLPVPGPDARQRERMEGIWRLGRRLAGSPREQLRALEDYCREQAWFPAAAVYADLAGALALPSEEADAGARGPRGGARRLPWHRQRGRAAPPQYGLIEMRAW